MIQTLIALAQEASKQILKVYNDEKLFLNQESKTDKSPLTLADKLSNKVIVEGLASIDTNIPIISEEEKEISFYDRIGWTRFWLVDPLDGTKEFIKRNGQFTVNIALIENGIPTVGVIDIPCQDFLYYAYEGKSFILQKSTKQSTRIRVAKRNRELVAVGSSSHASEEETYFLQAFDIVKTISIGSSIKFCYVADGQADIYYRSGPTMEWDTAAGQAIVEGAGGKVEGLSYNKENLLNGSFVCKGW